MASNNPFLTAQYEKTVLTKQTAKRIQLIYKQSAEDIKRKLRNLNMVNPSDSLKKMYLENLLKDINKSSESFNRLVQSTVMSSGEQAGNIAVEAGNKAMRAAGLDLKGAYSYIPRQQMEIIASGKLYGGNWSLSQSIWKNGLRTKSDIQNVVSKGLAQNKPIKDIADDITKYVDPTARKPWDWSKVYPGTAQQVDYNAQRLARTMIQHSFQVSMVQSQLYNPFCKGIIWYSVGIHGRTCELCMERDGQVFPVKDLPLDHPNGLCYFEPALDKMDDIADRLANWVGGESDVALDTYVAKAFGLNPKSTAGKRAVNRTKGTGVKPTTGKRSVGKKSAVRAKKDSDAAADAILDWFKEQETIKMNKAKFIDDNFGNLKAKVIESQKTKKSGEAIWTELRKKMISLEEDQLRYMSTGQKNFRGFERPVKGQTACFKPGHKTIVMDLVKDMNNSRGAFGTFFHEYGHLLDHAAVGKKHTYFFTFNTKFRKALYSSLEKEYNKIIKADGTLKSDVKSFLMAREDTSSCVQDIISGLSQDSNRVFWGHSKSYWIKKGDKGVSLETMAHFNQMMAFPEQASAMEKYFPESYKLIKDELERYLKAKGLK